MVSIAEERRRLAEVGLVLRRREQWGSVFDYTNARAVEEPATRLFLHITITNPDSYSSNDAHARAVERIGINRFPATGISYNGLILPGGHLYEAQPWGRRGAHTVNDFKRSTCSTSGCPGRGTSLTAPSWNLNYNARALSLARNTDDPVTDTDVDAAARWGAGYKLTGLATRDARWHGHRCVSSKSCPGSIGFARLDEISALTETYVRNGLNGEDDVSAEEVWKYKVPGGPQDGEWTISVLAEASTFALDARNASREAVANQAKILAELTAIRAAVGGDPVDEAALAAALAPLIVPAIVAELGDKVGATAAEVEQAIRNVLGSLNDLTP